MPPLIPEDPSEWLLQMFDVEYQRRLNEWGWQRPMIQIIPFHRDNQHSYRWRPGEQHLYMIYE